MYVLFVLVFDANCALLVFVVCCLLTVVRCVVLVVMIDLHGVLLVGVVCCLLVVVSFVDCCLSCVCISLWVVCCLLCVV